jgi:hypothetical protein
LVTSLKQKEISLVRDQVKMVGVPVAPVLVLVLVPVMAGLLPPLKLLPLQRKMQKKTDCPKKGKD